MKLFAQPAQLEAPAAHLLLLFQRVEERRAGPYMAVAYVLSEVPESEVLRGIVHTDAKLPSGVP